MPKPRLVAVPAAAAHVDRARAEHLEVVERLHDRDAAARGHDDGRDGELRIQLVRVHYVGPKLVHEPVHRHRGVAIPERAPRTPPLCERPRVVARGVGHGAVDEDALVLEVRVDCVERNRTSWPRSRSASARPRRAGRRPR